jgi:hypothetical protein
VLIPKECEGWIKVQRPQGEYLETLEEDFRIIEPHLPEKVESILDIGCGMAGIDVFLKRKFPNATLALLDSDGDETTYGWHAVCNPYSSRKSAEALLAANGVKADRWHDVGTQEELKADLVISLISWGFHYPISTYKVTGFCIADLRRKNEKPRGKIIASMLKSDRCAFVC